MIVTRTPFRVTLGGGGTDLPSYYEKHGGMILAMGIDKYMYVMLNPPIIDSKIRLHYTQSETVDRVDDLRHELAREALRLHGITDRMEISSLADLPAGTGVGSSSCYLVGLLLALRHYRRDLISLQALAEEACHIELNVLRKGIGKQDQYMAAFGGLTQLEIQPNGQVDVRSVPLAPGDMAELVSHTHIYFTGVQRDATEVLADQHQAMRAQPGLAQQQVADSLHQIKELGYRILEAIQTQNFDAFGLMLHAHWCAKKKLSSKINLSRVDGIYDQTRARFGVLGGKIIGAGGGGFLMLYCPTPGRDLEEFMLHQGMPRLHYSIESEGAKVVASLASSRAHAFHPAKAANAG